MTPQKLRFDKACEHLNVDDATREKTWNAIMALGLSPDNPMTVVLAANGVISRLVDGMENATKRVPAAFASLPRQVEEAAKRAVGPVAEAATAKVEEAHARLAENTGAAVAGSIEAFFTEALRQRRFLVSAGIATAAVVIFLLALLVGYLLGRWNLSGVETEAASFIGRADWSRWVELLRGNADLNKTIAGYCVPGSSNITTVQGVNACTMRLWLGASAPAAAGGPVVAAYSSVASILNGYSPWTLALGGVAVGLLARKALKGFSRIPGVRWLTD